MFLDKVVVNETASWQNNIAPVLSAKISNYVCHSSFHSIRDLTTISPIEYSLFRLSLFRTLVWDPHKPKKNYQSISILLSDPELFKMNAYRELPSNDVEIDSKYSSFNSCHIWWIDLKQ